MWKQLLLLRANSEHRTCVSSSVCGEREPDGLTCMANYGCCSSVSIHGQIIMTQLALRIGLLLTTGHSCLLHHVVFAPPGDILRCCVAQMCLNSFRACQSVCRPFCWSGCCRFPNSVQTACLLPLTSVTGHLWSVRDTSYDSCLESVCSTEFLAKWLIEVECLI